MSTAAELYYHSKLHFPWEFRNVPRSKRLETSSFFGRENSLASFPGIIPFHPHPRRCERRERRPLGQGLRRI